MNRFWVLTIAVEMGNKYSLVSKWVKETLSKMESGKPGGGLLMYIYDFLQPKLTSSKTEG